MPLTYRSTVGRRLTVTEGDGNISHLSQSSGVEFVQSGTGAVATTVSDALKLYVHTSQYSTQGNYETARDALTGTTGVNNLDVSGTLSANSLATSATSPLLMTNGQLVSVALTAQTVGATTLSIPDFASVVDEFTFKTKAQTMSNKTFVAPALGTPTSGVLTNCTGYPGTSLTVIDAAGDGIIGTAADTAAAAPLIYGKIIHGLTYDNGTDATNDININTGGAMDATGARWMRLATALGKQSDVAWAVGGTTGAPAGGLDTGAVGNSDYYIWLIARSDTGVVDVLFSLSSTAPTMPTNYDFKRLIGWFKRVGGTIVAFTTYETEGGGIELAWNAPTLDVNLAATLTTSRRTDAPKVPLNFSVMAELNVVMNDAASNFQAWVYCPDHTDAAPSATVSPLCNVSQAGVGTAPGATMRIRTSSAGLIAARASIATVDFYGFSTMGFTWARRN